MLQSELNIQTLSVDFLQRALDLFLTGLIATQ